jgi:hypothetical protein
LGSTTAESLSHAAYLRSVGRREIGQTDTFSLLAELALGLTGFTGVAAAFGGSDRAFSGPDRFRLLAIFLSAASVLVGSLSAILILMPFFYRVLPRTYAFARDPDLGTSILIFGFVAAQVIISGLLLVGKFIFWREAWPLFGAFSVQLALGLFLFARILLRPRLWLLPASHAV